MILHFVTENFPPTKGGLEMWTYNHAAKLAKEGFTVIIHITGEKSGSKELNRGENELFEINELYDKRAILEEPLVHSNYSFNRLSMERARLNFLVLRNSIQNKIKELPNRKHIIISNFLIGTGFLSSLVSEDLSIPHIACVVGTDYSRGFYNSQEREIIAKVVKQANKIITWNNEQSKVLNKAYNTSNIKTIHTSISSEILNYKWVKSNTNTVHLFSDCGYSHKKGTQILIKAFDKLVEDGISLKLTICGETLSSEEKYWTEVKQVSKAKHKGNINFINYLPSNELRKMLITHDIYCSATIGEGCSLARVAALCTGIPIVTTLCGEMTDISAHHIRKSLPGDVLQFIDVLKNACIDFINGKIQIDTELVNKWSNYFTSNREVEQWKIILNDVALIN